MKLRKLVGRLGLLGRNAPYLAGLLLLLGGGWAFGHWRYPDKVPPSPLRENSEAAALLLCAAGAMVLLAYEERERAARARRQATAEAARAGRERDLALREVRRMRARTEGLALMREIHRSTGEPDREERFYRILTLSADLFEAKETALFALVEGPQAPLPAAYLASLGRSEIFLSFTSETYAAALQKEEEKNGGGDGRAPLLTLKHANSAAAAGALLVTGDLYLGQAPVAKLRARLTADEAGELPRGRPAELTAPLLAQLDFGPAACRAAAEVVRDGRPLIRCDRGVPSAAGPFDDGDDARLVLAAPLIAEQQPVGVLRIRRSPEGFSGAESDSLEEALVESSKHIALALKKDEDDRRAVTDGLTKLLVKKRFLEILAEKIQAAEDGGCRRGKAFVLVMLDIDHFKNTNDTYGHLTGDIVLRETAAVLSAGLRVGDLAFRYGGEEMALILHTSSIPTARRIADRLRRAVAETRFIGAKGDTVPTAVSMGLAAFEPGLTPEQLISRADQALYFSKENGRNRVTCWTKELPAGKSSGPKKKAARERHGSSKASGKSVLVVGKASENGRRRTLKHRSG